MGVNRTRYDRRIGGSLDYRQLYAARPSDRTASRFVDAEEQRAKAARRQRVAVDHAPSPPSHDTLSSTAGRFLRLRDVIRETGYCRSMIYLMESEERFPRRIRIGVRAVAWLESEVNAWKQQRIAANRGVQLEMLDHAALDKAGSDLAARSPSK